ncbi:MAG: CBS domain-containing protein [Alphaproteobacteria bacterium]|uniref:CBS domain-containing protein n=1 Tax=Candidatus Nitrobium versatile TaxID=2884831 RepID=A0A953M2X1_9BACT|nr:CBS domain-containing protein [Candidatus Nitrobium versatile]
MEEKVRSIMRRGAITCSETTSVRDVAQIMIVNRSRYCVVINREHEVTGIISADSILRAFGKDPDTTTAADILLPHSIITTPVTPLREAIDVMSRKRIEHLIVVSDRPGSKAVLGIVFSSDIVRRMAEGKGGRE